MTSRISEFHDKEEEAAGTRRPYFWCGCRDDLCHVREALVDDLSKSLRQIFGKRLVSKRVYKPAFPLEYAMAEMLKERGRHFDPGLLDIFAANRDLAYWIAIKMV